MKGTVFSLETIQRQTKVGVLLTKPNTHLFARIYFTISWEVYTTKLKYFYHKIIRIYQNLSYFITNILLHQVVSFSPVLSRTLHWQLFFESLHSVTIRTKIWNKSGHTKGEMKILRLNAYIKGKMTFISQKDVFYHGMLFFISFYHFLSLMCKLSQNCTRFAQW